MQQDAHEFLNYLLNTIADLLQEEKSQERQQNGKLVQNGGGGVGGGGGGSSEGGGGSEGEGRKETQQTWVHEIFQGTLTNETRCLNCEAVSGSGTEGGRSFKAAFLSNGHQWATPPPPQLHQNRSQQTLLIVLDLTK